VLVLDEPTNDLDMDTLDLLEDLLADYEGTLILVSHDRDFIDRLATSTIALDGRGNIIETPGGWAELIARTRILRCARPAGKSTTRPAATARTEPARAASSFPTRIRDALRCSKLSCPG